MPPHRLALPARPKSLCCLALIFLGALYFGGRSALLPAHPLSFLSGEHDTLDGSFDYDVPPAPYSDEHVARYWSSRLTLPADHPPRVDRAMLEPALQAQVDAAGPGYAPTNAMPARSRVRWPPLVAGPPGAPARGETTASAPDSADGAVACPSGPSSLDNPPPAPPPAPRFLLPLRIRADDPPAQTHLLQLAHLAAKLGRTLVLPNVARGRMGACLKFAFGDYYAAESVTPADPPDVVRAFEQSLVFARADEGAGDARPPVISMDDFAGWIKAGKHTSAQLVTLATYHKNRRLADEWAKVDDTAGIRVYSYSPYAESNGSVRGALNASADDAGAVFNASVDAPCLSRRFPRLRMDGVPPLAVLVPRPSKKANATRDALAENAVLRALSFGAVVPNGADPHLAHVPSSAAAHTSSQDPDVLVIDHKLRDRLFPHTRARALEYSPFLEGLASHLAAPLAPYAAVRWSADAMDPASREGCTRELIRALGTLAHGPRQDAVRGVWFLGPQSSALRTSPSAPQLGAPQQADAHSILRSAFAPSGALEDLTSTTTRERLMALKRRARAVDDVGLQLELESELLEDEGARAIVDQLVAKRAVAVFGSCGDIE